MNKTASDQIICRSIQLHDVDLAKDRSFRLVNTTLCQEDGEKMALGGYSLVEGNVVTNDNHAVVNIIHIKILKANYSWSGKYVNLSRKA